MITYPTLGNAGRLGNQLWQIAGTLGIANRLADTTSFPPWAYSPYFSMPPELFTNEPGIPSDTTEFAKSLPPQAQAYLQNYWLWNDMTTQIREYFKPSKLALGLISGDSRFQQLCALPRPILSLHVRRGDNAYDPETPNKADYHPLRPTQYYFEAAKLQAKKYGVKSIAVFSDDIEWCKVNFAMAFQQGDAFYWDDGIVRPKEHTPEYATAPVLDWIDFFAMTFCDHHVISNSTYSWWAAFLSGSPSPVYPAPWYGPALSMINADLMFPPEWTRIDHSAYRPY